MSSAPQCVIVKARQLVTHLPKLSFLCIGRCGQHLRTQVPSFDMASPHHANNQKATHVVASACIATTNIWSPQVWGTLLALPYVLTRGVLPFASGDLLLAEALQAAFLWGWLAEAGLLASYVLSAQAQRGFAMLHNTLRDEKYLVGRELRNYPAGS